MLFFHEDWSEVYGSTQEIEEDLHGFKFHGTGWYEEGTDTLYIVELQDGRFHVFCWNWRGVRDSLAAILDKPVR